MIKVEYDDGKPKKQDQDRVACCVPKGRERGYYAVMPDGTEHRIGIGFMRIGEIEELQKLLNLCADSMRAQC